MSNGATIGPGPDAPATNPGTRGQWRLLVASNRGPVSFHRDDEGTLQSNPGGGALLAALTAAPESEPALWVCASLSDSDRAAARSAPDGRLGVRLHRQRDQPPTETSVPPTAHRVRMLDIEALTFSRAYNGVANSVLWYVHHLLCDTARMPTFDARFRREWSAYVDYNRAFADAIAEDAAPSAKVVVQDYHLALLPRMLREQRPDLAIAHFAHTPWAPPDYFRILPDDVATALLEGHLAADHAGFLTTRWARAFLECCEAQLGATVDYARGIVEHAGRRTEVAAHSLGVDADSLRERAARPDVRARMRWLRSLVGGRRLILRVDRTERSKNTVRGLLAYREFLRAHPEWHGRVVHLAITYPGYDDLPDYHEYTAAVQKLTKKIIDEFGSPDWDPLVLTTDDDFARSLAAYRMADVAVVNPLRDGMSSVAKEIPTVSDAGCALVLSREAGAAAELATDALLVNPYDVDATAGAIHRALAMTDEERGQRSHRLAASAATDPPAHWFGEQLAALDNVALGVG